MIRTVVFSVICLAFTFQNTNAEPIKTIDQRKITDVTKQFVYKGVVVSAFEPALYRTIPSEENAVIVAVFHFQSAPKAGAPISSNDYYSHRIEVYGTSGDWMDHGFIYFVTDAKQCLANTAKKDCLFGARAYYIPQLSTSDREEGKIPPQIDVFAKPELTIPLLKIFIRNRFLTKDGFVNQTFEPLKESLDYWKNM